MIQENNTRPIGLRSLTRKQVVITFTGVMVALFLSALDQTVVGTAMPRIISDLGGFSQYTWVTTAYIIAMAVVVPITGKLTDIYGRKYFYIAGISLFIFASIMCGLSNTMNQIIIFRGIQGIGAGVMLANAFIVIGDLFPSEARGRYHGFISAVFGISSIIGPMLGGYITDQLSWHWVFFLNVPLGVIILVPFIFFFPNFRQDNLKHDIDYAGVILLILCIVPMMLALSWGGVDYPWGSVQIIGIFIFTAVALAIFIWVETRVKEPIIPLSIFKNSIVSISWLMNFITGVGLLGCIIFVPLFFQGVLGSTATSSGTLIMPMMLGNVFGAFISGQLLSRAGGHYRLQGVVGLVILVCGLWLLSQMNIDTPEAIAMRNMIIAGFGLGITMPIYILAVQNVVPYKILGAATSSMTFSRSLGGSVGLAIFGSILNNRFAGELATRLPVEFLNAVPQQQFNDLVSNPQALISTDAQVQLQQIITNIGDQSGTLYDRVIHGLREALSFSISGVFFYAFIIIAVSLIINLFLKEIPLRQHGDIASEYQVKSKK